MKHYLLIIALISTLSGFSQNKYAQDVLTRTLSPNNAQRFELILKKDKSATDSYTVNVSNNKIVVTGNTSVALCRGAYDYLKNATHSMYTWNGNNVSLPLQLPSYNTQVTSPFPYKFYMNVVTHGYTTCYWDWQRWEKEIDWMALHGMNMPLVPAAHEAILYRVFQKIGLNQKEIESYFTGPAHFPWNRMGNIVGWDGPPPTSYYKKQIQLWHQILDRMKQLGMKPIVPAFAGFVPEGINRLHPEIKLQQLNWGGFDKKYQATILSPNNPLFLKIGKLYIEEWEKEFGKNEFYLADSFNEMDIPLPDDKSQASGILANYGISVYEAIKQANPNATWVMQGWTFPYQRDKNGNLFWTKERLKALMSKVPDDKLLILDLANEYNLAFWKVDPSWKMYDGFFGKKWIYSFIPNMGGKTPWNGILSLYATAPESAIKYEKKGNLVGFGFAPEGIENNEMIYELLSDWGWRSNAIDLNKWIENYCLCRYGSYSPTMKEAFQLITQTCYGTFTDHPRFGFQNRPGSMPASVNKNPQFFKAVEMFLQCSDDCKTSKLYQSDAIELTIQYVGLKADSVMKKAILNKDYKSMDTALVWLTNADKLLASHPTMKLDRWVNFARGWGNDDHEKNYYESNAKRLITTWGGEVNEYACKAWSGFITTYYVERWKKWEESIRLNNAFDSKQWEENWIKTPWTNPVKPFDYPIEEAKKMIKNTK
jgi:alpha-N-acetylglucosaminidase